MSLYQFGLSQDILLNFNPMGRTDDGKIRVHLGHNALNFRDATVQFLCGSVKLLSHCVTGVIGMTMSYSLSGSDVQEGAGATTRQDRDEGASGSGSASAPIEDEEGEQSRRRIIPDLPENPEGRFTRTTPSQVAGLTGRLPQGKTLAERLQIINTELNKDYKRGRGTQKYGKISNWPITCTRTRDGYIRSRWSHFALLATDDVNFFRQLGYADHQIKVLNIDGRLVYSLGSLPVEEGDVVAFSTPTMDAVSVAPAQFFLVPRRTDIQIRFEAYASDVPATPAALKTLLDHMIVNANHKYRVSILDQDYADRYIWPATAHYTYLDDLGVSVVELIPANIFPIQPDYGAGSVELSVNTGKDIGSVREVIFDEMNVFGFGDMYRTWDDSTGRNRRTVIESVLPLGVRDQVCEISSVQLFQCRGTLTGETVNASIAALFLAPGTPTTFPLTFFPKNRLSSSISYNHIDFDVRSRYVHPSVAVTKEVYQYSLIGEIRNVE